MAFYVSVWLKEHAKTRETKEWINEPKMGLNFYLKSGADAFVISSCSFDFSISNRLRFPSIHTVKY